MKLLLILLLISATIPSFGQMSLQEIENPAVLKRIEWVKAKTDSFLLTGFKRNIRAKFSFEFEQGGYFMGEMRGVYVFLNSDKHEPDEINGVTHDYQFSDEDINLVTAIDVYCYEGKTIELRFQSTEDALKKAALNAIYNKGLLNKIKATIKEQQIKHPYTIIQVSRKMNKYFIFLKDKASTHTYQVS